MKNFSRLNEELSYLSCNENKLVVPEKRLIYLRRVDIAD